MDLIEWLARVPHLPDIGLALVVFLFVVHRFSRR